MQHNDAYKTVIADLVAKRAEIDRTLKVLKLMSSESPAKPITDIERPNKTGKGLTTTDAVKHVLDDSDGPMTFDEIVQAIQRSGLSEAGTPALRTALYRLCKKGNAVVVKRGLWGLPGRETDTTLTNEPEPSSGLLQNVPDESCQET